MKKKEKRKEDVKFIITQKYTVGWDVSKRDQIIQGPVLFWMSFYLRFIF
jgi:hypothetical protein